MRPADAHELIADVRFLHVPGKLDDLVAEPPVPETLEIVGSYRPFT
jgi:hypothetical protein